MQKCFLSVFQLLRQTVGEKKKTNHQKAGIRIPTVCTADGKNLQIWKTWLWCTREMRKDQGRHNNNPQSPSGSLYQSPWNPLRRSLIAENKACLVACLASWAVGKRPDNSHNYSWQLDNAENVSAALTAAPHPTNHTKPETSTQRRAPDGNDGVTTTEQLPE